MINHFYRAPFLVLLLASCGQTPSYRLKNEQQRHFIASQGITQVWAYENNCKGSKEELASKSVYDAQGDEVEYESFLHGETLTKTAQVYDQGLLVEKTYYPNKNMGKFTIKYEYNEKGIRIKYAVFDEQGNRISLHKIERKGGVENISDYDAAGKLTNYRTVVYDSLDNPLVFETRKLRYSYNARGLMTESASVDTLSGTFIRRVFEYREFLPVKQSSYYSDSCFSVIRYEYKKASGEKW